MFTSPQFAVSGISVTNNMADEVNSPMQFSSGEKEVIERKLNVRTEGAVTKKDINDFYEISRCVDVVKRGNFQKVRTDQSDHLTRKNIFYTFFFNFSDIILTC